MKLMTRLLADQEGAAVAEYGLFAAVAGVAIAVASIALGSAVTGELASSTECAQGHAC